MQNDAIETVKAFIGHWGPTAERLDESFDLYFNEDTVWENVGISRTVGVAEAKEFLRTFPVRFSYLSVDMLFLAADGNAVLTERLDHFHDADGTIVASIRIAGTLEVERNRIVRWRDYSMMPPP